MEEKRNRYDSIPISPTVNAPEAIDLDQLHADGLRELDRQDAADPCSQKRRPAVQSDIWDNPRNTRQPPARSLSKIAKKAEHVTLDIERDLHSLMAEARDVLHLDVPRDGIQEKAIAAFIDELTSTKTRMVNLFDEVTEEVRRIAGEVRK